MEVLFVGQCKQGSNSLFDLLDSEPHLKSGHDIRAIVRTTNNKQSYISNWRNMDLSNIKYLLDKSIVNPDKYDYHVLNWQNYNHKMIYMIRNIYKMLKSQFLVVLAGEESYEYNIPKFEKTWDVEHINEETIKEIMDYNKHKYTHYYNLINLPKDVFDKDKNIFFCTFEDFIDDYEKQITKLEEFLNISITGKEYPKLNSTMFEWYANQTSTYEINVKIFEKYKDFIYDYCIDYDVWEKLSDYIDIDLIDKYGVKK